MAIRRLFLDWDRPGLTAAADYLIRQSGPAAADSPAVLDLEDTIIVVPGSRAGRRLEEILLERAEQQNWTLKPPLIETVGKLPEQLYARKKEFAEELVQQLAWVKALKQTDPQQVKHLLPNAPAEDDRTAWLSLGAMLGRLHRELAADAVNFRDVADCGAGIEEFREQPRWQALAEIQTAYLETLDGLDLWDRQTARLFAIREAECHTEKRIVLVGLVDMNRSQRLMLDQVAEAVTALVFAPQRLADRFDGHGCVRPEAWQDAGIDLKSKQIEVVGGPTDQAAAVVRALASLEGRYAAEQITVGVPDERIVPQIRQQLEQCEIPARYGPGVPVLQSGPCRLLGAVADHLESGRFAALAALVRHPDVQSWLDRQGIGGDWLSEMDRFHTDHLPHRLDRRRLQRTTGGEGLQQVCETIEDLLRDLAGKKKPLGQWGKPVLDLLAAVFGQAALQRNSEPDRTVLAACEKVRDAARGHLKIPAELVDNVMQKVTAAEAVHLMLQQLAADSIAPPPDRDAVELLGWLELPLDDAPVLIVTGCNEGFVPKSVNADQFLPNRLRGELGIEDNGRRLARDAYALGVLAASRRELRIIAGRRTGEADPLSPSRLLFACDDQTAARRAKTFFSPEDSTPTAPVLPGRLRPGLEQSDFGPPQPRPLAEPVDSMRVTEFRDYLACPYRYYLKHRLGLGGLGDADGELDAAAFGSLAHDVLSRLGRDPLRDSTDVKEIAAALSDALDRLVLGRYGTEPLSAVRVQVEQLRRRLEALAAWQADWAAQGWRIEHVETQPEHARAALAVDGKPMLLRGRIDRIDFNPAIGRRIVFDYKSSDALKTPDQAHRQKGQWVDLQLPLYRHLVEGLGIAGPVELGYIVLPKDTAKVGCLLAEWTDEDLHQSDRAAHEVVRLVRREVFWPPASPPPAFAEEFAAICGDEHFGSLVAREEVAREDAHGGNGQ